MVMCVPQVHESQVETHFGITINYKASSDAITIYVQSIYRQHSHKKL